MTTTARPRFTMDHVGIVVPDLKAASDFYENVFGFRVVSREDDTDVDPDAIGLPGERVRLRGTFLDAGGSALELHQYLERSDLHPRRISDQGLGHFAVIVDDIQAAVVYLAEHGVSFNTEPRYHGHGDLAGLWWVYATDPWGNVFEVVERTAPQ